MFTDNIAAVLSYATPEQHAAGVSWYNEAHNLASSLSPGDVWRGAGVIAAYSPLTPWWRNVELAMTSLNSGIANPKALGNSVKAAQRILDGEHTLDVLKGDKTRAFAENIALNGISEACTVDVHAFSIAMGTPVPSSKLKMGKNLYREIAFAYSQVADDNSLHTPQLQAIVWVVWRDLFFKKAARKEVAA